MLFVVFGADCDHVGDIYEYPQRRPDKAGSRLCEADMLGSTTLSRIHLYGTSPIIITLLLPLSYAGIYHS